MKKIQAKKKGFLFILALAACLPLAIIVLNSNHLSELGFDSLLSLFPLLLFLWIYYSTSYGIQDQHLHYHSAFIKGKIDIATITRLQVGKNLWSGLKPALSTKGIIINYNRFDEIYVAPINNKELVDALLEINPAIAVEEAS